jgi:hypothetical protein
VIAARSDRSDLSLVPLVHLRFEIVSLLSFGERCPPRCSGAAPKMKEMKIVDIVILCYRPRRADSVGGGVTARSDTVVIADSDSRQ